MAIKKNPKLEEGRLLSINALNDFNIELLDGTIIKAEIRGKQRMYYPIILKKIEAQDGKCLVVTYKLESSEERKGHIITAYDAKYNSFVYEEIEKVPAYRKLLIYF